ncbi:MAG TPA: hypothetical protein VJ206_08555 [bacterium]|nr:hypothetical protein [bacterium]
MKRVQITIDEKTAQALERLATPRAGNKSFVVREAVRRMAQQEGFEDYLDWLEHQPDIRRSTERAVADEREGRTLGHEQALKRLRKAKRR